MKKRYLFTTVLMFIVGTLLAQQVKLNSKITVSVHSVNEDVNRSIFIQFPKDYGKVNKRYPLIVLFDAQDQTLYDYTSSAIDRLTWTNDIPEAIFVGIVQNDRSKELNFERYETSSLQFLNFIKNDLINYLSNNYFLNGYYTLIGHSLGGQFATNAMLTYPETFKSVISVSGALNYEEKEKWFRSKVVTKLNYYLSTRPDSVFAKQKYYFSTGDEGFQDSGFKLGALTADSLFVKYKPNSKNWHFDYLKGFNHMTTPLISIPSGLIFVFQDWHFSETLAMDVLMYEKIDPIVAMQKQLDNIKKMYGTEIALPYNAYSQFENFYFVKGELEKASILANKLIKLYPNDDDSYATMADILEKKGDVKGAIKYLKDAQSKSNLAKYADRILRLNSETSTQFRP
ncbi:alpha/beta hydrolase-fold protein [Mucilaginibacter calamicampi]|uniref:Alpha/beta hydrolase-fold protein n=1 Tax=Mucilaginibacter calamicampi TaxID=1302352 RepID=A0ABW2YSC6_9SPHI